MLFLKCTLHDFPAFAVFSHTIAKMSEGTFCRVEVHICSNTIAHPDKHSLLSDKQHAFRKWHNSETQLTTVIDDCANILDNQGQVDTFIFDFEKRL